MAEDIDFDTVEKLLSQPSKRHSTSETVPSFPVEEDEAHTPHSPIQKPARDLGSSPGNLNGEEPEAFEEDGKKFSSSSGRRGERSSAHTYTKEAYSRAREDYRESSAGRLSSRAREGGREASSDRLSSRARSKSPSSRHRHRHRKDDYYSTRSHHHDHSHRSSREDSSQYRRSSDYNARSVSRGIERENKEEDLSTRSDKHSSTHHRRSHREKERGGVSLPRSSGGGGSRTRSRSSSRHASGRSGNYESSSRSTHHAETAAGAAPEKAEDSSHDESEEWKKRSSEKEDRLKKEEEIRLREEENRKKRELEEARRDDMTVLVMNLSLKAGERDVYEFFAEHAGRVRDIQCIKDQRSGKSKGVAYVEFYTQESVIKALALSGQTVKGQSIVVNASQAEKNRAAKAAKQQQTELADGPMRIYVGGLVDSLSNISPQELQKCFSAFGEILGVEIQRDPYTGRSRGYAFIQFKHASEAKEAMAAMNGYSLAGRPLKVGYATESTRVATGGVNALTNAGGSQAPVSAEVLLAQQLAAQQAQLQSNPDMQDSDRLDDDGGGLLSGTGSKLALMQKLQRGDNIIPMGGMGGFNDNASLLEKAEAQAKTLAGIAMTNGLRSSLGANVEAPLRAEPLLLSRNIILSNMYTQEEAEEEAEGDFYDEMAEEVTAECSKFGSVERVWLKRGSVDGMVWVRFSTQEEAVAAANALRGRNFSGRKVGVDFVDDSVWSSNVV